MNKILCAKVLIVAAVFFGGSFAYAGNPTNPILPADNIQDPGAGTTPWGGCTPADTNCYVTNVGGPGSFSTLTSTGNTTLGTGAGTVNTIGNASGTTTFFGTTIFNTLPSLPLTTGSILVGNGSNIAAAVAPGTNGQVLQIVAGVPTWSALPSGTVSSVFGRTGVVIATAGDYTATQITNTPAGTIAGVTVQAALDELDSEKLSNALASGSVFIGNGSGVATAQTISGDATITNAGILTISNSAITLAKLAADSVNSAKIVDGSIALADLAGDSVDTTKIVDATITNADISATAAIAYSKLSLGNSIVLGDLTADSVNSAKIVNGSIVAADLATDSVTSAKILDGEITNADISATAAIALSKLASGTSGNIIVANAGGVPTYVALSGDATIDNLGALTIANLAVTNAKLAADAVTSAKIQDGTIAAADFASTVNVLTSLWLVVICP
jgi:hypothetical protein